MKKFIKSVAAFSIIMAIAYIPLLLLWGDLTPYWLYSNLKYKKGHGNTILKIEEAQTVKGPDVLILGSSHAYRGFDVRLFKQAGYTSFNLGTGAQTHLQTNVLLQRYLKKIQPKCIIYEVYPDTFMNDGTEGATDLIANDSNDSLSYNMVFELNNLNAYNTLAYGVYHDLTRPHTKEKAVADLPAADTYIPGGYVEKTLTYYRNGIKRAKRPLLLEKQQLNAFQKNITLIKQSHIPYVLVFAPVPKSLYNAYDRLEKFEKYLAGQGPYLDYNKKLDVNDSLYFFDDNHLNQKGVDVFNKALLSDPEFLKILHKKSGL